MADSDLFSDNEPGPEPVIKFNPGSVSATHPDQLPTPPASEDALPNLPSTDAKQQESFDPQLDNRSLQTENTPKFLASPEITNNAPSAMPHSKPRNMHDILIAKMAKKHKDSMSSNVASPTTNPIYTTAKKSEDSSGVVQDDVEDHSWMEDGHYDDCNDPSELATLMVQRDALMAKNQRSQSSGESLAEMIHLMREIDEHKRKNRGEEETMFVTDEEQEHSEFSLNEDEEDLDDDENQQTQKIAADASDDEMEETLLREMAEDLAGVPAQNSSQTPAKTPRRPAPKNAREVNQRREEIAAIKKENQKKKNAQKAKKQPAKKAASNKRKATSTGRGKGKKKKKDPKDEGKNRMKNHFQDGEQDPLTKIMRNLLSSDPITERMQQGDYDEAPKIEAQNKDLQFALILGSVPKDYDTHKAKTQKKELLEASKRFGRGQVKAADGLWKMKGLKTTLYHYQLLGVDWMTSRELSRTSPHGGLVADAMGLGKTLQVLATMVQNPPPQKFVQNKVKCTLIVVPATLISQWRAEIILHTDEGRLPRVYRYRGLNETELPVLKECDIVLTTYAEVMRSFPYPSAEEQKDLDSAALKKWIEKHADQKGNLHRMKFYRIVLDEAHNIKNFKSRTSLACLGLNAEYRWALTGTPIQNNLSELYPYFRFLRSDMTSSMKEFKKYYADADLEDNNARMQVALSVLMIRRTIKDRMFGRPILELPNTNPATHYFDFSKEEAVLYRIIENRFRETMNQHLREGTAKRNYGVWMVQLLRLRQATAHPFLLEHMIKDIFTAEDLLFLQEEFRKLEKDKMPIYEQVKQWIKRAPQEPKNPDMENAPFGSSDFGKRFKMGKYLENMGDDEFTDRVSCRLCGDCVRAARKTGCGHIFCGDCIINNMHHEAQSGSDHHVCPECDKIFLAASPFKFQNPLDEEELSSDESISNHHTYSKGKDANKFEPKTLDSSWLDLYDNNPTEYDLIPSTKSIAIKSTLCHWLNSFPTDKVIIFVQWRLMARILGRMLNAENWSFVYYTGDMKEKERAEAVRVFHTDNRVRVMVAGLKCGGIGLNLTCANRVISVDLWWNHSVEQQAFGRVFRIGQKKETYLTRMVIKNTVDARILDLQSEKVKLIDQAMQDNGEGIEPLSPTELANLFGFVRENEDGVKQIYPDYQD